MTRGIDIVKTSKGSFKISFPFRVNITIIVNNSAIKVIGLIRGRNLFSYHSSPYFLTNNDLVTKPAKNGIPR